MVRDKKRCAAPPAPSSCERRKEHVDATKVIGELGVLRPPAEVTDAEMTDAEIGEVVEGLWGPRGSRRGTATGLR